jgi:NADH-quinone oxidoreductase subunit M
MLLAAAAAVEQRLDTSDLGRLTGLAQGAPLLALLVAVALAVSLGVPGLAGFWGTLLVLIGAFARHPVLAVVFAGSLVASAAAHVRVARFVLLGGGAASGAAGGRDAVPEGTPRELAVLVSLAAVALLLGLWPVPLLSEIADGVRDVSSAVDPSGADPTVGPR